MKERRVPHPHVKEQKKQVKVCDVTEPQRRHQRQKPISMYSNVSEKNNEVVSVHPRPKLPVRVRPPKPVDEDLYKIPPELLRSSKRVSCFLFHLFFFLLYALRAHKARLDLGQQYYFYHVKFICNAEEEGGRIPFMPCAFLCSVNFAAIRDETAHVKKKKKKKMCLCCCVILTFL